MIVIIDGHGNSGTNNVETKILNNLVKNRTVNFYNIANPAEVVDLDYSNNVIKELFEGNYQRILWEGKFSKGQKFSNSSIQNKILYKISKVKMEGETEKKREWIVSEKGYLLKDYSNNKLRVFKNSNSNIYYIRVNYKYNKVVKFNEILKHILSFPEKKDDLIIIWAACRAIG